MIEVTFTSDIENITANEHLYQWDYGQMLQISGVTVVDTPTVHFANKKSKNAFVVEPTISGNIVTAHIPNSLLTEPYTIIAYFYSYDDFKGNTLKSVAIPVEPRVEPDDRIFVGDEGFITLGEINSKVNALIERTESDYIAFKNAQDADYQGFKSEQNADYQAFKTAQTNTLNQFIEEQVEGREDYEDNLTGEFNAFVETVTNELGYKKGETLSNGTKELFGMDNTAVPNDVFAYLGNYSQHRWLRKSLSTTTVYVPKLTSVVNDYVEATVYLAKVLVYDTIVVDELTGEIILGEGFVPTKKSDFLGRYLKSTASGGVKLDSTNHDTEVYFIRDTAELTIASSSSYIKTTSGMLRVDSEQYVKSSGDEEVVYSSNPDQYPHDGEDAYGNFSYRYLGVPFENTLTSARLVRLANIRIDTESPSFYIELPKRLGNYKVLYLHAHDIVESATVSADGSICPVSSLTDTTVTNKILYFDKGKSTSKVDTIGQIMCSVKPDGSLFCVGLSIYSGGTSVTTAKATNVVNTKYLYVYSGGSVNFGVGSHFELWGVE